jgi:exonuclease SbcC
MDSIKQRLDLVAETTEATCPLCGQSLDENHRQRIHDEFQEDGTQRGDQFRANVDRIKVIKDEIAEREQSIKVLDKSITQLAPLRSQLGSLEQQQRDAQAATLRRREHEHLVDKLRAQIADGHYAEELQIQLQEAFQQRDDLSYDENAHDAIRETLTTYKVYQDQANQLEIALSSIPDVEQSLEDARARETRWCEALEKSQIEAEEIEAKLDELQAKVEELQKREAHWNHQRTIERQAHEKRTALRQTLLAIEDMRRRYTELENRQNDLREEQSVYEQLKNAFSKNGIPAMVIEAAIPELEEEANRLLRRMTEGRMVLRFDTQREKKTGGVAETFDIWISDELGTRDYSMYSGGEAFRINFAIRVAISQLLARRAGAQLRTLFIDEGFGTHDEMGRERLVEAIIAIQDEFDLLIVITHIDELRDAFPVRIEIEKLPEGSRIRII